MNWKFFMFISIFIFIYGLINYYIGLRGWQFINGYFTYPGKHWLWICCMTFLAISYPLGRFLVNYLPPYLGRIIIYFGSYWLAVMYYLLIILIVIDFVRLINRWINILPEAIINNPVRIGWMVVILVSVIVIYGTWNAHHPVIKNYEVTLNKKSGNLNHLHIAAVSDIHLGWINGVKQMSIMADIINDLNPDLVVLPGDIIDEGINLATEQKIPALLRTLHPEMGTFAIMGNHEYISGNADKVKAYLQKAGVTVLRDEYVNINNSIYLVGRDDHSSAYYHGMQRKDLAAIMKDIDNNELPILLLDHQPSDLQTAEQAGIDLQISGHTHKGQIWPNNYITRAIFEKDWGYLHKNNLQLIVSCGYGTWGPPIRVGNRPEIVNILIKFEPSSKVID